MPNSLNIPNSLPKYVYFALPGCPVVFRIKRDVGLMPVTDNHLMDSPQAAEEICQTMNVFQSREWGLEISDKVVGLMMQAYAPEVADLIVGG